MCLFMCACMNVSARCARARLNNQQNAPRPGRQFFLSLFLFAFCEKLSWLVSIYYYYDCRRCRSCWCEWTVYGQSKTTQTIIIVFLIAIHSKYNSQLMLASPSHHHLGVVAVIDTATYRVLHRTKNSIIFDHLLRLDSGLNRLLVPFCCCTMHRAQTPSVQWRAVTAFLFCVSFFLICFQVHIQRMEHVHIVRTHEIYEKKSAEIDVNSRNKNNNKKRCKKCMKTKPIWNCATDVAPII